MEEGIQRKAKTIRICVFVRHSVCILLTFNFFATNFITDAMNQGASAENDALADNRLNGSNKSTELLDSCLQNHY